jgi:hypothetical protein
MNTGMILEKKDIHATFWRIGDEHGWIFGKRSPASNSNSIFRTALSTK